MKEATLNEKEQKVWAAIKKVDKFELNGSGDKLFPGVKKKNADGSTKKDSWVRNSLRRLIDYKLVKKVGRGEYESTGKDLDGVKAGAKKTAPTVKPTKILAKAKPPAAKKVRAKPPKEEQPANSETEPGEEPTSTVAALAKTIAPNVKQGPVKRGGAKRPVDAEFEDDGAAVEEKHEVATA